MNTLYQNAHSSERGPLNALQYLDVIFVVIGAIIALALGAPAFGVIVGAAGWILQRAVEQADRRFVYRLRELRQQVGVRFAESFARIWLLAGAIIFAGVAGTRNDGLAAALLIFVAYSVALFVRLLSGPPSKSGLGE